MKKISSMIMLSLGILSLSAYADTTVSLHLLNANDKSIGSVTFKDTRYGLLITPNLSSLPPGFHGFHIHEKPSCDQEGMAAGGHLDPKKTTHHLGPYNDEGHLGDLPVLYVDETGSATTPVIAPKIKLASINQRTLMIHTGPDNYTDNPPMGGGGSRYACGIIKK